MRQRTDAAEPRMGRYVLRGWHSRSSPPPLRIVRAQGVYVVDDKGRRYADLSSQLVSSNLGHGSGRVGGAIMRQLAECAYVSPEYGTPVRDALSYRLCTLLPPGFETVFLTTGGSSAVNAAIAAAMQCRGASTVVSRHISYHGSTGMARGISSNPRTSLISFFSDSGIIRVPAPHCSRCPLGLKRPTCRLACVACIRSAIEAEGPGTIAAFVAEPVTGTSGVIVPPKGYYEEVRALCDEYGILWIADEVLTGFGRTGTMFAFEHWDAVPDIVTMAKGLTASYLPLGAAVFNDRVSRYFETNPFPQGHTYSGHPVSCAASLEVLSIYEDIDIVHNAARLGRALSRKVQAMASAFPLIREVRGIGCLWALDFSLGAPDDDPGVEIAARVCEECSQRGVLLLQREALLIIAPPLVTTISELSPALDAICSAVESVSGGVNPPEKE